MPFQPGAGYRFVRTASGVSLDVSDPFPSKTPVEEQHPFKVTYDGTNAKVRSGTVNSVLMEDQDLAVPSTGTHYIYIECHASAPPTAFPTSVTCDFAGTMPTSDEDVGYVMIATINDSVVSQMVYTSLGAERHHYVNPEGTYYYFWRS